MNRYQKQYIEDNINLIENKEWNKFFASAPDGIGSVLYASDVPFMSDMEQVPYNAFCNDKKIRSVVIPDGVTRVGPGAFYNCMQLKTVVIPKSVTTFSECAFEGCLHLNTITYDGTISDWNNIVRDEDWDNHTGSYIVQCTDGVIKKQS